MKTQNHKIVAILLVIVTILSFILPSLTPQINASPEDSDYYMQKHIVTDNYTNNVNKDALSNGEIWTDKTVSTGPITIDGYDFETEEFIVQLSSIAKQVQQSKEPADIVILLDVTGSSSNPIKGYTTTATGRNGSNSFLVMAVNEFIDIVMASDARNKVAVITYGGTNMYIQGTDTRLGSAPVFTLLELGHYSNPSWAHEETYIVTEGEGSVTDGTYMGGKIVEGKYISFYESSWQNSVWDYIEDEAIRNLTWLGNYPRYTFKVQSNEQVQEDGTLYPKTTSYTNWGGTGTQNAIYEGTDYLLEHVASETAVLVVLTDGLPTIISFDYTEDLDYCSDEITHKEYTPPTTNDGKKRWTQVVNEYDATKVFEKDGDNISNAVLTIAGATYNKERLKEAYENAYIYTVSVYDNNLSHLVLDPSNLASDTTADGIEIYNHLENIFKNNKSITLPNGAVLTNKIGAVDYCYSDNYYFAKNANIKELVSSFEDITKLISGNACGEIVFTDVLGNNMELKAIKGVIVDGVLYSNFIKTNNTYTFPELEELSIVVSTENNKQKIEYTVPEQYTESLVRLIFEVGVSSNYDYTSAEEHIFYSNTSCQAKFTLANNNNYNGFNKTVNKSQNKTNTATYVSQSTKDDLEVTVNLGNNGLLTVNRLENKIDLKLTKIWNDNNDILGFRPDSIRVNIYNGVVLTATTTLTKAENMVDANTWEKTISLPKYTEEGEVIEYTIEEEEIILENGDKYTPLINGSTITNVLTHTGKISITKIWKDDSNKYLTRPDSIEVIIMKNGQDYKTITLSAENATTINPDIWQVIDIDAPAYDTNGNKNTYTIKENTNNINLMYYYNDPIYDQNTLTVTNEAVWLPVKSNSNPEYRITILKEIINKDNVLATANDFNKVKLNINDTFEFPIILKELERTLTKGESSMIETYGDYTGNIYRGIVTNNNQLIFSKINPGKYEISEESVEYFNFIDFSEISKSEGAMFTEENGKYYITLSGITGNYEDIVVKVTNKIDETREYNKTQGKDNLLKQLPLRINSLFDPIPPIPPEPKPGEVYVNKIVNTDKIIVEGEEFYSEDFLIQLEAIIKQVHESKEPVDIMIMLDSTGSTHNPIYGYGLDAEDRNGSQDDFIVAINEFIDIIMASHEENRIGVTCYGAYNRIFKNTTVRYGSEPMFTILELGHYTNPDWTHSKSYIFTPGEGSIANKTYKGGGVIQGKYISWFESSQNNTVWDYLNDTSISATTRKATWFSHRFG